MEEIELKVIGCGDAFATGGRNHSCFYLKSKSVGILIDLGATAFVSLKQQSVKSEDVDFILISHLHGDHYGGLPFFLLEAAVNKRSKNLTIISPPGIRAKLDTLLTLLYPGSRVLEKLKLQFISFEGFKLLKTKFFTLLAVPVVHSKATLPHGLRIEIQGRVLSYSGDTEWTPNLKQLADGADLFICECNFYKLRIPGHFHYGNLQQHLPELNFKAILLTHLGPDMLANRDKINLDLAEEGQVIRL